MRVLQSLLAALVIFTRIPVPWTLPPEAFTRASLRLPLLGWLIGGLQWALLDGVSQLVHRDVALFLALVFPIVLSAGMHEDGLADFADGMLGGSTTERRLEIMKDPRVGSYGVLALLVILGGSFLTLRGTASNVQGQALLLTAVLSRAVCIPLLGTLPYLNRAGSRSQGFIPQNFHGWRVLLPLWPLLPALALLPSLLAQSFFLLLFAALFLCQHFYLKETLKGITGDCLGAAIKIAEFSFLLLSAVLWPGA